MVAGGWNGDYVESTEILVDGASSWVFAGRLPTGRFWATGITVNNRLFMMGNIILISKKVVMKNCLLAGRTANGDISEVIEFEKESLEWRIVGNTLNSLVTPGTATSVVSIDEVKDYCALQQKVVSHAGKRI